MTTRSLIAEYLPHFDFCERHQITVRAAPQRVYAALRTTDLARSVVVRGLLLLRALPARLRDSRRTGRVANEDRATTLEGFQRYGFAVLEEIEDHELLIGLVGRFWTIDGGICATDSRRFRQPPEPGSARVAWNFLLEPTSGGTATLLSTETRIEAADEGARRAFARYWIVIRPFSALTRRLMLKAIRDEAEGAT